MDDAANLGRTPSEPATRDIWASFSRFAAAEIVTGGPDPQVELAARATDHLKPTDAAVFIGCFVAPYTCGAAGPLFAKTRKMDLAATTRFINHHWDGLPRRRERRVIDKRSGEKLAECLETWKRWVVWELPNITAEPYPVLYESLNEHVRFMGRYAAMKALEGLHQRGLITNGQDSICARGAKYPRRTLAQLWPADAKLLTSGSDKREAIERCDYLAAATLERLSDITSWFDFETLLCNYRQALKGKYPGRSHDRELAHFVKAHDYWGYEIVEWFDFYNLRARLFPRECLGELGTPPWFAARPELEVPFA